MEQKRIEFILRAEQPIAHHEESFGNSAVAMRRKVRQPDGTFQRVPVITADTMRHGLREASTLALLDAAGMLDDPALTTPALRLLFSGGMITGSSGGSVKLGDYRELVDMVPPLALLGGCAQNRTIPGRLFVDDATLICHESIHMLPEWVSEYLAEEETAIDSHRASMEEVQRVRMDPTLYPGKRALLSSESSEAISRKLIASEEASEAGDSIAKDAAKSSMLPRRFERIAQGALFYWSVTATTHGELEEDTLWAMVGAFLAHAVVGGKKGTGHGLIRGVHARQAVFHRPAQSTAFELSAMKRGDVFRAHVTERADKIRDYLAGVAA